MIPNPMGNIIAAVAVLLIHMEMNAAMAPKTNRRRPGRSPIQRMDIRL